MRRPRRNHSPKFNARVAVEGDPWGEDDCRDRRAPRGASNAGNELERRGVGEARGDIWRRENSNRDEKEGIRELHAKTGELTVEREFLEGPLA